MTEDWHITGLINQIIIEITYHKCDEWVCIFEKDCDVFNDQILILGKDCDACVTIKCLYSDRQEGTKDHIVDISPGIGGTFGNPLLITLCLTTFILKRKTE